MTLARTATRWAVIEALRGATMAQGRVWDSRVDDLNPEEYETDAKPTAIVFTDKDEGEQLSLQNGGPPFGRMIDVTLELGMVGRVMISDTEYVIDYPTTEPRLEASLDLFEFQAIQRLATGLDPVCIFFRKIARIVKYDSHRQVIDEGGVKIACRLLTLTCNVQDDRVKIINEGATQPEGADLLPYPLRDLYPLLPEGSATKQGADAIIAALTPVTTPAFFGVDVTADGNNMDDDEPSSAIEGTIEMEQPDNA